MPSPNLHLIAPQCEADMPQVNSISLSSLVYGQKIYATLHLMPLLYAHENEGVLLAAKDPQKLFSQVERIFFHRFGLHLPTPKLSSFLDCPFPQHKPKLWISHPLLAPCFPSYRTENPWPLLCQLNSKLSFVSFLSPHLETRLCSSFEELDSFLHSSSGPWVLKVPYQAAGNKMLYLNSPLLSTQKRRILEKYFAVYGSCLLQKRQQILREFSTQWKVKKEGIDFLGCALSLIANKRYQGCQVGGTTQQSLEKSVLKTHLNTCRSLLSRIREWGYKGPLGIDAMEVLVEGKKKLIPFTEINARETFASLALKIHKKHFPDHTIQLKLQKNGGLFPASFYSHLLEKVVLHQNLDLSLV